MAVMCVQGTMVQIGVVWLRGLDGQAPQLRQRISLLSEQGSNPCIHPRIKP
jgi:hypothetical protein